ncbi:DUF3263 domain-containing protein [Brachybacterium sp. p3-SID1565]|uniref:DUF3263 domain-containing protein n=1 Tax=Brachybacterium epidermidis TaxID=2781983 RepID=A0ABR9W2W8_9MICO|nr:MULTISPECIES: DUF3263 domain-containing protein [Brachybacterium]MBE9404796.1 DUF3263 domain-containing protein [Brachybacterium epidermidis]MCT1384998.1 DUF3263 domain-containing protein [Brachybacterium sp. p3-SID1565]
MPPADAHSDHPSRPEGAGEELSERDRRILELESRTFRFVGTKERVIREQLAMSRTAYYVRLNALLDDPAALRAAPALVNRLRDRRTSADDLSTAAPDHRVA